MMLHTQLNVVCSHRSPLALSDPNINPAYLSTLVFVGSNLKLYVPPMNDIWQRYLRKFSKNGKLLEDACSLISD